MGVPSKPSHIVFEIEIQNTNPLIENHIEKRRKEKSGCPNELLHLHVMLLSIFGKLEVLS